MIKKKKFWISGITISLLAISLVSGWVLVKQNKDTLLSIYFDTDKEKNVGFFTVHYQKGDEALVKRLEDTLPKITTQQERWFNLSEVELAKVDLDIYLSTEIKDVDTSSDEGGLYLKMFEMIHLNKNYTNSQLENLFSHEMAHFYFVKYVNDLKVDVDDIPNWVHEGVAMSFAQRVFPEHIAQIAEVQPLRELEIMETEDGHKGYTEDNYLEMLYAIEYLIYQFDEKIMTALVVETKKEKDFTRAFTKLTSLDLDTYHEMFETNMDKIKKFENLMQVDEAEAEKQMLLYMEERGEYFNEASLLYTYLGSMYVNQQRYSEALKILEKQLLYHFDPTIYKHLSEVAFHVDKEKSLAYTKEAVESARRNEWNVEAFEQFLSEQEKLLKAK
jgi:tetratricopeptide (TPR) repeat protein